MREVTRPVSLVRLCRVRLAVVILCVAPLLCLRSVAAEKPYTFTTVDLPLHYTFQGQARDDIVQLVDVNRSGAMIGTDGVGDGFVITADYQVTEFRCPGDVSDNENTTPAQMSNTGFVVGSCVDGVAPAQQIVGFMRAPDGTITLLRGPGATGTWAYGINDLGDVVGEYFIAHFPDAPQERHGFVWKAGVYTSFDAPFPNVITTTLLGINDAGEIIGSTVIRPPGTNDISEIAFLYASVTQTFTPLVYPGATMTWLLDITNDGVVLGAADDRDNTRQYFLYQDGQYFTITDASHTVLDPREGGRSYPPWEWGINDQGALVGTYVQRIPCASCGPEGEPWWTFVRHSFRATPTPPAAAPGPPVPPAPVPLTPTQPVAQAPQPPPGPTPAPPPVVTLPPAPTTPPASSPSPPVVVVEQPPPSAPTPQEPAPTTPTTLQDAPPTSTPPPNATTPVVMTGTTGGSAGASGGCTLHPGAGVDPVLPGMGGVMLLHLLGRRVRQRRG